MSQNISVLQANKASVIRPWIALAASVCINLTMGINYSFSLIGKSLVAQMHWTSVQATAPYMSYALFYAITMFFSGRLQETFGPRKVATVGSLFLGGGMASSSFLTSMPPAMAFAYGFAGLGNALCFSVTIPSSVTWFSPRNRGLVAGIVVAGISLAPLYFSPMASYLIESVGVSTTLRVLGTASACVMIAFSQLVRLPPADYRAALASGAAAPASGAAAPAVKDVQASDVGWPEILKERRFLKLWLSYFFSASAALLILVHVATIAKVQAHWENGFYLVMIFSVFNTAGRVAAGSLSDKFGRLRVMLAFFALNTINTASFVLYRDPFLLGLGTALTALSYGAYFALFPVVTADLFGMKRFAGNYGLLFTAWGAAGFLGPFLGGKVMDMTGSYAIAYAIAALLLCAATAIALTVSERLTERENEWGARASRFLKAELKRAGIGYMELAERLNKHGPEETETSIAGKLARGTFAASFSSPVWRFWRGRE